MKKVYWSINLAVLPIFIFSNVCFADYAEELRKQIQDLERKSKMLSVSDYLHDMGIIARKADDAGLAELTTQIVRTYLFKTVEAYVQTEMGEINTQFEVDPYQAAKRMAELNPEQKFFKPSADFLNTSSGQVLSQEISRGRADALTAVGQSCSSDALGAALVAYKKTNLFLTNRPEEIDQMRKLFQAIDCCLGWSSQIKYKYEYDFETDYDSGKITEEANLNLQSDKRNFKEAQWVGDWKYHIKAQRGSGDGLSQATLKYVRGQDIADLTISNAKLNSVGTIFMPIQAAGEQRQLTNYGNYFSPELRFSGTKNIPLKGCVENKKE